MSTASLALHAVAVRTSTPRPPAPLAALPPLWSPQRLDASVERALHAWNGRDDLWVFAYGSLIWNPDLAVVETRRAKIFGLHRSLCLWSTVNRGTPDCPGLVLGLDAGGSCEGVAYRVAARDVRSEFRRLWHREMSRGSYAPTWLKTHTPHGAVHALAFVMLRDAPTYAGRLDDDAVLSVLAHSCGRYGTTAEYVRRTVDALHAHGLRDARLERCLGRLDRAIARDAA